MMSSVVLSVDGTKSEMEPAIKSVGSPKRVHSTMEIALTFVHPTVAFRGSVIVSAMRYVTQQNVIGMLEIAARFLEVSFMKMEPSQSTGWPKFTNGAFSVLGIGKTTIVGKCGSVMVTATKIVTTNRVVSTMATATPRRIPQTQDSVLLIVKTATSVMVSAISRATTKPVSGTAEIATKLREKTEHAKHLQKVPHVQQGTTGKITTVLLNVSQLRTVGAKLRVTIIVPGRVTTHNVILMVEIATEGLEERFGKLMTSTGDGVKTPIV